MRIRIEVGRVDFFLEVELKKPEAPSPEEPPHVVPTVGFHMSGPYHTPDLLD